MQKDGLQALLSFSVLLQILQELCLFSKNVPFFLFMACSIYSMKIVYQHIYEILQTCCQKLNFHGIVGSAASLTLIQ